MTFEQNALKLFSLQYEQNIIYNKYCSSLQRTPDNINCFLEIPFIPIALFKNYDIKTGDFIEEQIFLSSTSSGDMPSKHFVKSLDVYVKSFVKNFNYFYQHHSSYCFLCLLPNYLQRQGSSLVYMAEYFIKNSKFKQSGFFLNDIEKLATQLQQNIDQKIPTILLGVSYALLDFAEKKPMPLQSIIVMETGGMKGRREEILRDELHNYLKQQFNIKHINSEYGMTELLSQAYSLGDGIFQCLATQMQVFVRPLDNPLETYATGKGALNIVDFNNTSSCSFIATDDIGEVYENGTFKVYGRLENASIRGCNQLID